MEVKTENPNQHTYHCLLVLSQVFDPCFTFHSFDFWASFWEGLKEKAEEK